MRFGVFILFAFRRFVINYTPSCHGEWSHVLEVTFMWFPKMFVIFYAFFTWYFSTFVLRRKKKQFVVCEFYCYYLAIPENFAHLFKLFFIKLFSCHFNSHGLTFSSNYFFVQMFFFVLVEDFVSQSCLTWKHCTFTLTKRHLTALPFNIYISVVVGTIVNFFTSVSIPLWRIRTRKWSTQNDTKWMEN